MDALEESRLKLYASIENSKSLVSQKIIKESQKLDKLILESMNKTKGGFFKMISDCKECANKGTELCKLCAETSGGRPSQFKPIEPNKEA